MVGERKGGVVARAVVGAVDLALSASAGAAGADESFGVTGVASDGRDGSVLPQPANANVSPTTSAPIEIRGLRIAPANITLFVGTRMAELDHN